MRKRARLLAATAVAWSAWIPGQALANTGAGSLSVQPTHGQKTAPFTATFTEPGVLGAGCPPVTVAFSWDGAYPLGSASLTGPDPAGNCYASRTAGPPGQDDAARGHTVSGDDGNGNVGEATYTIDRPPSPAPTPVSARPASPAPKPSAAPSQAPAAPRPQPGQTPPAPAASPAPIPTPNPPGCSSWPQINVVPESRLVAFDKPVADFPLAAFGPGQLLPPRLSTAGYPGAVLTLAANARTGVGFRCMSVSLGPTATYLYARYLFEEPRITAVSGSVARATISIRYREVFYDYRAFVDGQVGPEVSGHGLFGSGVAARSPSPPWPLIGSGLIALLGSMAAGALLIRRSAVGSG